MNNHEDSKLFRTTKRERKINTGYDPHERDQINNLSKDINSLKYHRLVRFIN